MSMLPLLAAALAIGLPLLVAHAAAEHGSSAVAGALKAAIPLTVAAGAAIPALGYRFRKRGAPAG
jgi:hypothetical protein